MKEQVKEEFKDHVMKVKLDQGVYRHIYFSKPNLFSSWFELISYPGTLVVNGDFGSYTFSRENDMFEFFWNQKLNINEDYWAQKCVSSCGPLKVFSVDKAKSELWEQFKYWFEKDGIEMTQDDLEEYNLELANNFKTEKEFWDLEEERLKCGFSISEFEGEWFDCIEDYTERFIFSLHAIVWGINEYKQQKKEICDLNKGLTNEIQSKCEW